MVPLIALFPGLPGTTELIVVLLVALLALGPAILVLFDADRREGTNAVLWALVTALAGLSPLSLFGSLLALVAYYLLAVRGG
jgi:hypothetical protein